MGAIRFFAAQLRQPKGWFGRLVLTPAMNRVNRHLTESTLSRLQLRPQDRVLEVGFGGGIGLELLARRLSAGQATGVDISPDVVRRAERRFRRHIAEGRIRLRLGEISQLPFADAEFDRAFTVNTIYFWPDTLQGFRELQRVLKDGGLAAVSLRSRQKMEKHSVSKYGFRLFAPAEVADLMQQAGFRDVQVEHSDQHKVYDEVIVVGAR